MRSIKIFFVLSLFLPVFANCQTPKSEIESISAADFQKLIASNLVFLVDVRTITEFNNGHIKGAFNADVNSPDFVSIIKSNYENKPLALYCRSGRRSKIAASSLSDLGVTIYELNYGFTNWIQTGLPVEK